MKTILFNDIVAIVVYIVDTFYFYLQHEINSRKKCSVSRHFLNLYIQIIISFVNLIKLKKKVNSETAVSIEKMCNLDVLFIELLLFF